MAPRKKTPSSTDAGLLDLRGDDDFLACVAAALSSAAQGRPNALLHLDVARAADIRSHCGDGGLHALRDLVSAMAHNQLGPTVPVNMAPTCAVSLLLPDVLPSHAIVVAKRLRGAIDNGTFSWHGHPFRLGAHIGLVELGPQPTDPQAWLRLAREACVAARDLGGSGIRMVTRDHDAWRDLERDREWHDHLTEVI